MDNTDFIYASIKEVMHTFVEALLIVALIVYIFLQNWRSTLIPMIAVPVSLLGTFASFLLLGFTINTLTLFAMVLAIGLVVDDAIVVIEAVEYEMRYNNLGPKEATVAAMQKVQSPVIGVAVVLAAVFVPVAFLGGIMGILYKQFALTIAVSVLISAFVALSLTPALCAGLLKPPKKQNRKNFLDRFWDTFNDGFDRMVEIYGAILQDTRSLLRSLSLSSSRSQPLVFSSSFRPHSFRRKIMATSSQRSRCRKALSMSERMQRSPLTLITWGRIRRSNSRRASPALIFCPVGRNQMQVFPSSN